MPLLLEKASLVAITISVLKYATISVRKSHLVARLATHSWSQTCRRSLSFRPTKSTLDWIHWRIRTPFTILGRRRTCSRTIYSLFISKGTRRSRSIRQHSIRGRTMWWTQGTITSINYSRKDSPWTLASWRRDSCIQGSALKQLIAWINRICSKQRTERWSMKACSRSEIQATTSIFPTRCCKCRLFPCRSRIHWGRTTYHHRHQLTKLNNGAIWSIKLVGKRRIRLKGRLRFDSSWFLIRKVFDLHRMLEQLLKSAINKYLKMFLI